MTDNSTNDLDDLLRVKGYASGAWIESNNGRTFEVTNPANDEIVTTVQDFHPTEFDAFVEGAQHGYQQWRLSSAPERAQVLSEWHRLILENEDGLASLMTSEQGKPIAESVGEVRYAAAYLKWFAEEARRTYGDVIPAATTNRTIYTIKEPIGLCVAITPWNFPLAMITRKAGPAIAAGCSILVKPSEETPLSALALAELAHRAGVPAGVFSVIPTTRSTEFGEAIMSDPRVNKVSFTGSTRVGQILANQSGSTLKRLSLELGGNAPLIVFDDADIDAAVEGALSSKYRNAGQTCVCTNRILVHSNVAQKFTEQLKIRVETLVVGDGREDGVSIGPLINEAAIEKVDALVSSARAQGSDIIIGGSRSSVGKHYYEPTIVRCQSAELDLMRSEIFGPVAAILEFETEAEAIELANDTKAGLAAYLFSRDVSRVMRVSRALQYGMVGVNTGIISSEVVPFGGVKYSGYGREGSKYGLEDYTEIKSIIIDS